LEISEIEITIDYDHEIILEIEIVPLDHSIQRVLQLQCILPGQRPPTPVHPRKIPFLLCRDLQGRVLHLWKAQIV
jgi:hypothetical protein